MSQNQPENHTIDLAVSARWIVPVVPRGRVLEFCSLLINDDCIVGICPQAEIGKRYHAQQHLQLADSVLLPGLINAHGHAPMTLLRGYADDLPLESWLNNYIWPTEQRWVSPEFVADGSELAIAEMLQSGTTCFSDMYFFPESTAEVCHKAGMRAQLNFPVFEFANAWADSADDCIHKGLSLRDELRSNPLLSFAFGPHAPYTVSDATFRKIATYLAELQMPMHIHLHETAQEVADSIKEHGERPIERLAKLDLLGPLTQCVHFTQVTSQDIELLQTWQSSVIHCPHSNLKLASGFTPVQKLLNANVRVALGTDGAASNNSLNMFSEMKTAALLAKTLAERADACPAESALEMATIKGAEALGLEALIGSLEPGKQADFIAVDMSHADMQPVYDVVSQLVYGAAASRVSHVWIAGRPLLENNRLLSLDAQALKQKAQLWQQKITQR